MNFNDIAWFALLACVIAATAHGMIRRYRFAVLVGAASMSLVNLGHELTRQNFTVRPADLAFWIPMLFLMGFLVTVPVTVLVGIPFQIVRRKRRSQSVFPAQVP